MSGKKRKVCCFLWMAVSMLCLGLSLFYAQKACLLEQIQLGSLKPAGISAEEAERIQRSLKEGQDSPSVCFWLEMEKQWMENEGLHRIAKGTATVLCGSSDLLFPESAALHQGDLEGCLLGETLAYELFGNKNAAGMELLYGNRSLVVRDVLKEAPEGIAFQADKQTFSEAGLTFLSVAVLGGKNRKAAAAFSDLSNQYGLPDQPIAGGFYVVLAKAGASALSLYVLCCLVARAARDAWSIRRRPAPLLTLIGLGLFLLLLTTDISPYSIRIGKESLPSQWSDFSWYSRRYEQLCQEGIELIKTEKGNVLFPMLVHSGKAVFFGMVSAFSFMFFQKRAEREGTIRQTVNISILTVILGCAAALFLGWRNLYSDNFSKSCTIFLLYIWGDYALRGSVCRRNMKCVWKKKGGVVQ